jgi:hypothetical protein
MHKPTSLFYRAFSVPFLAAAIKINCQTPVIDYTEHAIGNKHC